jgi:signal transduction histidine kinase
VNSLERRLQLGLALSLVLLMVGLWVMGNHSLRAMTRDFVGARLEHDAESLLASLQLHRGQVHMRWRRIDQIYNQPLSGHYYTILLDDGEEAVSRSLWDHRLKIEPLAPGESRQSIVAGPAGQTLLLWAKGFRKQDRGLTLAVAEDLSPIQAQRDSFMRNFALLAVGGLLLLLLVQSLVVRRSFKPLERVREDIRRLEQGGTERLSEEVPKEILPLVREFNQLLRLLAQRLERSRNGLGNLAHALKGPLNLLTQYFDREEARQAPQALSQSALQVERIRQLMERELKRARLAGIGAPSRHFDSQLELPDLAEVLRQIHRQRKLDIQCSAEPGTPAFGDREDMLELLGNLLDNACKWAVSKVRCHISADNAIHILVEDDGQGLSDDALAQLTRRGVRLDEMVEGHGLGLAIAKDIVKLYGGEMGFTRSRALGGLRVAIQLPLQADRE